MNQVESGRTNGGLQSGRLHPWKWALLPGMAAVICLGYLWAQDLPNFQSPITARIIFWHVPMAILSLIWFLASAWLSVLYLRKRDSQSDSRAARAAEMGLILTTLATITGAVFSKMQWAGGLNEPWYVGYWQWDVKQTCILVLILLYCAYFGLRMSIEDPRVRGNVSAAYSIQGAVWAILLTYVIPKLPMWNSLHPVQVINTREGMNTEYRITFWLSTLMFLGITAWVYQLKVRLDAVALRRIDAGEATAAVTVPVRMRPGGEVSGGTEPV